MLKSNNLSLIMCFIILIGASSCRFNKDESMKIVVKHSSIYPIPDRHDREINVAGINESGTTYFNLINNESNKSVDTITLSKGWFSSKDTLSISFDYSLTLNKDVKLSQLEYYLRKEGFKVNKLRENTYWLASITKATIKEKTNQFGDVEGCYLVTPDGEYIDPEYWYYSNNPADLNSPHYTKYIVGSFSSEIAKKDLHLPDSYITVSLRATPQKKYFYINNQEASFSDISSNEITLNTENEDVKYKVKKDHNNYRLLVKISLKSTFAVTRWGDILYVNDASPFTVQNLNNISFR